ncbi:gliding motility lipoprotein GldB [Arcticibacter svalbardensis]|uniref:gliding motility lipoprotein GldB n=1 Tax=Arcticibacter svalbardensis TaxID=1288027 RepID=UPI0003A1421B|nr:gliding motility lipoprotein GldB [Arcticibacter svalbardensis]
MTFKNTLQIYLFFFITLFLCNCRNKQGVDTSQIKLDLKIERFDQELSALKASDLTSEIPPLENKYDPFYSDFIGGMVNAGSSSDTGYYANMRLILQNKDFNELKTEVSTTFKDMSMEEEALTDAFKRVKYYYPQEKIPRLISFFSGFAVQVPIGENYIGIGLDMFLGAQSKFYPALRPGIPQYISRRFTPENITPRVMETFVREDLFPEPEVQHTLLERMIYNGKVLYFMQAVLPDTPDSLLINYTSEQQQWAEKYESGIWGYFLENNLLYESDYMKIQKFLTEAPFTPGIGDGNQSAPKLALYSGWQIVKSYMDRNPKISIPALMKDEDYQSILNKSHYKPK